MVDGPQQARAREEDVGADQPAVEVEVGSHRGTIASLYERGKTMVEIEVQHEAVIIQKRMRGFVHKVVLFFVLLPPWSFLFRGTLLCMSDQR